MATAIKNKPEEQPDVGSFAVTGSTIYSVVLEEDTLPFYGSTNDEGNGIKILPNNKDYELIGENKKAQKIIRTFYVSDIVGILKYLSKNHKTSADSVLEIRNLLKLLKEYSDNNFDDPFSSFTSALYDALIFQDTWGKIGKEQFGKLIKIVSHLNNISNLNYDKVDKSISKLEDLGLDTTPF